MTSYASLDYEEAGYSPSDIVKLQLLVNKIPVDAISQVMHRSQTARAGRAWVTKFKEFVTRELFEVVIQASVGNTIVARETVKAMRKDVTAKLYGGDKTRRTKLLEKQKEGRKKLQGKFCPEGGGGAPADREKSIWKGRHRAQVIPGVFAEVGVLIHKFAAYCIRAWAVCGLSLSFDQSFWRRVSTYPYCSTVRIDIGIASTSWMEIMITLLDFD